LHPRRARPYLRRDGPCRKERHQPPRPRVPQAPPVPGEPRLTLVPPTEHGLAVAAAAVRAGQVVAYPTETVYGLGVDPFNDEAVQRLFDVKRSEEHTSELQSRENIVCRL